ncbi:MAG: HEPN domain-containing protein [Candidatus Micrarchaeota archaeon]
MDKELYDISFLTAYISIFHSARALLYNKGYKERSPYCLFEFVRQEFKVKPEMVRMAEIGQNYRETRRMVQYEGSLCSENAAKEAILDAKKFLELAKKEI